MYQKRISELKSFKRGLNQQMNEKAESVVKENEELPAKELNEKVTEAIHDIAKIQGKTGQQIRKLQKRERRPYFVK